MPNQQLITHARGHVTGEYAQNTVYLTGERVSDAGFYQNIRLSVQPSIGSAETCIRPAEDSGYNPRLFLGRMTDAPTEQILLSIASGGSGAIGYYSVYGYENGALRHLETVISLDGWLYSDTTDHYVGGKGFRSVSEDEASAVRGKYTYSALPFTPFAA